MPSSVFVSYAHDSLSHKTSVRELADALRRGGIDVALDQYVQDPPEGWPRWMESNVRTSNFVLAIASPDYERRANGEEEAGRGFGAIWESHLVYQLIYEQGTRNNRVLPVALTHEHRLHIPLPLRAGTRYFIDACDLEDPGYNSLYARLTDQLVPSPPPLGSSIQIDPLSTSFSFDAAASNEIAERYRHAPGDIVPRICEALENRVDATERYWLYITLGELNTHQAQAALLRGLDDPDAFARRGAEQGQQA